jgi:hypothetical protein
VRAYEWEFVADPHIGFDVDGVAVLDIAPNGYEGAGHVDRAGAVERQPGPASPFLEGAGIVIDRDATGDHRRGSGSNR